MADVIRLLQGDNQARSEELKGSSFLDEKAAPLVVEVCLRGCWEAAVSTWR